MILCGSIIKRGSRAERNKKIIQYEKRRKTRNVYIISKLCAGRETEIKK